MCVDNRGNEASLQIGKIYKVIRPASNDGDEDIRVIDEEREDYLYSLGQFVPVQLPPKARKVILAMK